MESPWPGTLISLTYVAFCIAAPRVLKGKKFEISSIVQKYNIAMIVLNAYIVYEFVINTEGYFNWTCYPVDYSENEGPMRIAKAMWWMYISKESYDIPK